MSPWAAGSGGRQCGRLRGEAEQLRTLRSRVQQQQRQLAIGAEDLARHRAEAEGNLAEAAKRDEELQRLRAEVKTLRKLKATVAEQASQLSLTSARIADAEAAEAASERKAEQMRGEVERLREELVQMRAEWAAVADADGAEVSSSLSIYPSVCLRVRLPAPTRGSYGRWLVLFDCRS